MAVAVLLAPASVGGESVAELRRSGARFTWALGAGTGGCPDHAAMMREIALRLGRDPIAEGAGPQIDGILAREEQRWIARIYVREEGAPTIGMREIASDAPSCAPIASALALAVALAIDPDLALGDPPAPAPAPSPAVPAPPVVVPAPGVTGAARSSPGGGPGMTVNVRGLLAVGLLPQPAAGVALAVEGPLGGRMRWSTGMEFFPEVRTADPDAAQGFGLTAAWLGACVEALPPRRVALGLCANVLGGAIHAVVYGNEPAAPGDRAWLALAGGARVRVGLVRSLTAEAGVDGTVALLRHRFAVGGRDGTVFQQSPVAGTVFVGLGLQLP